MPAECRLNKYSIGAISLRMGQIVEKSLDYDGLFLRTRTGGQKKQLQGGIRDILHHILCFNKPACKYSAHFTLVNLPH